MNSTTRHLRNFAPRLIIIVAIITAILLFYLLGSAQWLNLNHLLAERSELHAFVQQHYLMALLIAGLAYMLMTALSIPGGAVLSLLIGFLFGLWIGGTLIVIAATLGATIIFLIVRYLLGTAVRTWLKKKPQAEKLLAGFERNAFNYLLFVRFVPLFPFWLVNLASAFTAVRLRQYILATFVGIIPGSFIYANLGRQLGNIQSLHGLVSPGLIGALVLLGLFALVPVIVRRVRA